MAANPVPTSLFSMDLHVEGSVPVLKCSGRLACDSAEHFRSRVKSLLAHSQHVHLDLSEVHYIDSTGLGAVLASYVSAKSAGGELKLVNPSRRVLELLKMTHLASVFATYGE